MPYVLRNRETGQIRTSLMINKYDLGYYGTNSWDTREEAEKEAGEMPAGWEVFEVSEERLKLFNVKLRNNPRLLLFVDEKGQTDVREADSAE